jgi:hypothetical protein
MFQDIITYFSVAASAFYVLFSFYRILFPGKQKSMTVACEGCSGCELKNQKGVVSHCNGIINKNNQKIPV